MDLTIKADLMAPMTTLAELLQKDSELASPPEIYLRVSELLDSERASARQIGEVVETDPALTTRILKMVNSAYYGFDHQIASVAQAISILGRDRLRHILIGTVLGGVFGTLDNRVFPLLEFWRHSVKSALLGRYMAKACRLSEVSESLFTAGLLHEIGGLIIAQKLPDLSLAVKQATDHEQEDILMAETRIIGFTHCQVGAAFITRWGLPAFLADAALYHHTPRQAGPSHHAVQLIYIASSLAYFEDVIEQDEICQLLDQLDGWKDMGLTVESITDACMQAESQVLEVMGALGMSALVIGDD